MRLIERQFPAGAPAPAPVVVGESDGLRQAAASAVRIAGGAAKVLITGESGVGKDVMARLIHASSPRASQRFVPLNCASLPDTLLESELFGHVRGSFTGAYRDKVGKLQLAHRGTIFLDEIAEMSLRMQATLLRFLENGEIQPVGSDASPMHADVRVISATSRDLPAMVARGEFREDLLYRVRVAHLHLPPLRERRADVRPLIAHTMERAGRTIRLTADALRLLEAYHWPGNVRELQNVIEQLIAMTDGPEAGVEHLPPSIAAYSRSAIDPSRERRRRVADDLYDRLTSGASAFWEDVHPMFMERDLTRADMRQLIGKGLSATGGSYRSLLRVFGMPNHDYKRFLNFLGSHGCSVDVRPYRSPEGRLSAASIPFASSGETGRALAGSTGDQSRVLPGYQGQNPSLGARPRA